jgi:D-alanine--poly(phosphoribitol) ligase subunit 1
MDFNLAAPFFRHARESGSRLALSVAGVDLTYSELASLAGRVARWLAAGPARAPGFVGILASRSVEAYAGVLGTAWAGDAYVPINPKLPAERLAQLLRIIQPVALVVDQQGRDALTDVAFDAAPPRVLSRLADLPPHEPGVRPRFMDAEDTAYVIFTSGSTGVPKGVVIPLRAVDHLVNTMQSIYDFRPEDRFSKAYNLSFDGSVHDLFTTWNAGASLHPVPATQVLAPAKFIQEKQLTVFSSVPSTGVFLERMNKLQPGAFPTLRYTIFAGEPLPLRTALAWKRAAPNSALDNLYGPTETCVFSHRERVGDPPNVTARLGTLAIGKALPGLEDTILDEGELAIAGPQVAKGYLDDAERTAARFPVIDGKVWYRTGDLVSQDETGSYHHLGRIDNQVQILGHRVEMGEVETHLAAVCGSDSVACVAWPVEHGSARGIAAFHCNPELTTQAIRDAMVRRLPRYMVPQQVRVLESIPLTANGKIDRKALIGLLSPASPPQQECC